MQGTLAELARDPHALLARLREREPVCWVPELGAWLVTRYDLAVEVLRDARTFTVDDPRFTTARVTGPSMLSLDGAAHARHRGPFAHAFRPAEIGRGLAGFIEAEAGRLVAGIRPAGKAELRRSVAGPLAAAVMAEALGLTAVPPPAILSWYDGIVTAVSELAGAGTTPGAGAPGTPPAVAVPSFTALAANLREAITPGHDSLLARAAAGDGLGTGPGDGLGTEEIVSNAAVLLFGGIETTEGMISNAVLHLLSNPAQLKLVRADPALLAGAVEESLRLEPAAAVVDRYATSQVRLGGAVIRKGDPVTVSIAAANRDPAVFTEPGRFDISRPEASRHLAFAHGPHFCLGAHLARLETKTAVATLLGSLPGLRLDPGHDSAPRGLVFRKPPELRVRWER
ncbi:MAG: cytochrome P450 [Streptosporangiaceae bacterium]|nr:cytochrome P450 [Streptosporangiaceae bacterium]MBV9854201.1 cytochrome P450 [Streptosporangiaceae bacterium]